MEQVLMEIYLREQISEISRYKWIESEKAGRDLGNEAILNWINCFANSFRKNWEQRLTRINLNLCKKYLEDESKEIEKHKWIESEKVSRDLELEAVQDWLYRYRFLFFQDWVKKNGDLICEVF